MSHIQETILNLTDRNRV